MRVNRSPRRATLAALLLAALPVFALTSSAFAPAVPPLVFVSRNPIPNRGKLGWYAGDPVPGSIPGIGPKAGAIATGGRLLVREPGGRVRELAAGRFFDVSDPAVSYDGRTIVFAARESGGGGTWRLWIVDADGRGLRALTSGAGLSGDRDPCWLPDGRIVFASDRLEMLAQEDGLVLPVTNLWTVNVDGSGLQRLTTERNGAEEPTIDPRTGRIVYARWWTNHWLASERDSLGLTRDRSRSVPADTVDLWQAVSIDPDGGRLKLAGGDPRTRATTMAYSPVVMTNGTLIGVRAWPMSLTGGVTRPRLQSFSGGFADARVFPGRDSAMCAPAALPDGRLVVSLDPHGRGDYGLAIVRPDGRDVRPLLDLPGTLELDAAILAPRPRPPVLPARRSPLDSLAVADAGRLHDHVHTFRFDCLNVFANAPLDQPIPNAVPLQRGARIRFYAMLDRTAATGQGEDSVVLVREADVTPWGGVHEDDMPADVPMFEQLVDAQGKVLRSAMGPAHVAGSNFAPFGSGTQCVGCHVGHSAIPVPGNYSEAKWVDATPSAVIEASSSAPECPGPAAVADRRTVGRPESVGWIAGGNRDEFLRFRWPCPIEVREVVLYPFHSSPSEGTDLAVLEAELVLSRGGRVVERTLLKGPLDPRGTHVASKGEAVDAAEIRFTKTRGGIAHRPRTGLLEVVTIARLAED